MHARGRAEDHLALAADEAHDAIHVLVELVDHEHRASCGRDQRPGGRHVEAAGPGVEPVHTRVGLPCESCRQLHEEG